MNKKVLVLGGTGVMGSYLVPELSKMGYNVDVITLDEKISTDPNVTYIKTDIMDDSRLEEILKNNYDAAVDFMIYKIPQFKKRYPLFTQNIKHYIFLSSYRVYSDKDALTTENSPRLIDVSADKEYLDDIEMEYSLYKAAEEDIIRQNSFSNWTIVRPAITFSNKRLQLVSLEANTFLYRAMQHKKVLLPKAAMNVRATMSWGGDVGKMLARLVLNEKAYGEAYSVCTAEHHAWCEVAEYYKELIGLEYELIDTEAYLRMLSEDEKYYRIAKYQLMYDRMFNRIMDNSKILSVTGMKQEELMPLKEGLKKELSAFELDKTKPYEFANKNMDKYLNNK